MEQHPGADLLASEALQHIVLAYFNERTRLLLCVERLLDLALGEWVWHSLVLCLYSNIGFTHLDLGEWDLRSVSLCLDAGLLRRISSLCT